MYPDIIKFVIEPVLYLNRALNETLVTRHAKWLVIKLPDAVDAHFVWGPLYLSSVTLELSVRDIVHTPEQPTTMPTGDCYVRPVPPRVMLRDILLC